MAEKQQYRKFTDGTGQADRFPKALKDGYIRADEMRFQDLLALGADYADFLKFYDLSNKDDRRWGPFFTSDALVIFARIMAIDLKKIESAFFEVFLQTTFQTEYDLADLPNYQLAIDIDSWQKHLRAIESSAGQKLHLIIRGVIKDKLRRSLHSLENYLNQSFIARDFDHIWFMAPTDEIPAGSDAVPAPQSRSDDVPFLTSNFAAFFNAVLLIQDTTKNLLPEALESQIHNPAIGMYVAFINLFKKVQRKLNRFTARHLDFYYRDVLKIRPRTIIPDRAYLRFEPDTQDRQVLIKSGTEFIAGTDENNIDVHM